MTVWNHEFKKQMEMIRVELEIANRLKLIELTMKGLPDEASDRASEAMDQIRKGAKSAHM